MHTHLQIRRWFFSAIAVVFFVLSLPAEAGGVHAGGSVSEPAATPIAPIATPHTDRAGGRNSTIPPIDNAPVWALSSPPVAPSARAEMGFVYDTYRNRILSVGGSADGQRLEDLWQYSDEVWAQHPSTQAPGGRDRPAIAYDPVRRVVVLFGGSSPDDGTFYNDTWEYDGEHWVQKFPQNPPSPRNGARMAYDPIRGTMVLFGGYRWLGGMIFYSETWEYAGGEWINRAPTVSPPARETAGFAFDSDRGVMVLFGGGRYAGSTVYADTWEWDGYNWVERTLPTSPPARWAHAMTYDQTRRQIVMNGGLTGLTAAFGDTWVYDGVTWREVTADTAPPERWDHGMAYDAANDEIVLFGGMYAGSGGFAWRDDTWIYRAAHVAAPRPVIFLPDFAGSALQGRDLGPSTCSTITDIEIWPNLSELLLGDAESPLGHLALRADGIGPASPCDEITSSGVIPNLHVTAGEAETEIQALYARLTEHLQETAPTVIDCHYDWRRSADGSLDSRQSDAYSLFDRVRQCVLAAQDGDPSQQVDIVAHGTGGLVAQGYLLNGGAEDVHTVIALGTPYMGSVNSFLTLRYGHMFLPALDPAIPQQRVLDLVVNWPALYQSLATDDFLTAVGGYFYLRQPGDDDYTAFSDPAAFSAFLADEFNALLVEKAALFQTTLNDTAALQGVRYFFFAGNNVDTPRWLFEKTVQRWDDDEALPVYDIIPTRLGDGVVPLESATLPALAGPLGATVCVYNKVEHWALARHPEVLRDVSNALLDVPLSAARCLENIDAGQSRSVAAVETDPSRQLIVDGGHVVHIWDDQGRHAGPVIGADVLENNIPQLTYWLGEERSFISLPAENTYTVTLLLTDTQTSEMRLRTLASGYSPQSSV
ncbi:MAG: hypothetical protein KDD84_23670, partial [Caldilineaceae bacterium]|nr:hypothetical protein [Caldilineaceae bacterium]